MTVQSVARVYSLSVRWLARCAAVIAGASFVYVALATALGVFFRYVLQLPSRFLFDSVEFAMGFTVFLALAFVSIHNGHVRMEVIPESKVKIRMTLETVSNLVSALVLAAFSVAVFGQFLNDLETGIKLGSNFGLPRWIPMLVLAIGLFLFALTLLRGKKNRVEGDELAEEVEGA